MSGWGGISSPGGGGGGTFDGVHNDLDGRSTTTAHPTSAITGLDTTLAFVDDRAEITVPSDGPTGVGTGGTITDVNPNVTKRATALISTGNDDLRAQVRLTHPSNWVGVQFRYDMETEDVYSGSLWYEVDTPATLGDLYENVIVGAFPYDCTSTSVEFSVNGVTKTFAPATDYAGDAGAFVAGLLSALGAGVTVEFPYVGALKIHDYPTALVTVATGSSATLTVTDAGIGDPLGFGALTSTPGVTDLRVGPNRTQEGTGNGRTHIGPDDTTVFNREVVVIGTENSMMALKWHQRNEYTQAYVTPVGSVIDGLRRNYEVLNILAADARKIGVPAVVAGAGAGTGPTISAGDSRDDVGIINVTAGTTPSTSATVVVVTPNDDLFGVSGTDIAIVDVIPQTVETALVPASGVLFGDGTWGIRVGATGLVAATQYSWSYRITRFLNP
jgi:hypothetical protein